MSHKIPGFITHIPILKRLYIKLQIYLENRRVKSSFGARVYSIPFLVVAGVAGSGLAIGTVWLLNGDNLFQKPRIIYSTGPAKTSMTATPSVSPGQKKQSDAPVFPGGVDKSKITLVATPDPTPEPTQEPTPGPTPEPTPEATPEPTPEPTPEATPEPTPEPTREPTPGPGPAPEPEEINITAPLMTPLPIDATSSDKMSAGESPEYMKTRADLVNVRNNFFLESNVIARLDAGYLVRVLKKKDDWVLTDTGTGIKGWIYSELLEDASMDDFEAWNKNPHSSSAMHIVREDLQDPRNLDKESVKIKELLHSWKTSWEEKDLEKYIGFYSEDFSTQKHDLKGYKKYKEYIFGIAGTIKVKISEVKVIWKNQALIAYFTQEYNSRTINSTRRKTMFFKQEEGGWKITGEKVGW